MTDNDATTEPEPQPETEPESAEESIDESVDGNTLESVDSDLGPKDTGPESPDDVSPVNDPKTESEAMSKLLDKVTLIGLEQLQPYDNNPKRHPSSQIDRIAASIKNYGFDQPIVVDEDNRIIKGHGRHQAAKRLGLDAVPAIKRDDLDEATANASRIADNRTSESGWHDDILLQELEDLEKEGYEAVDLGFDPQEYDDMVSSWDDEPLSMDSFEEPAESISTDMSLEFATEMDYDEVVEWFDDLMSEHNLADREAVLVALAYDELDAQTINSGASV